MVDDGFKDLKKRAIQLEIENLENEKSRNALKTKLLKLEVVKTRAEIKESKARTRFFTSAASAMEEKGLIFQLPPQEMSRDQVQPVDFFPERGHSNNTLHFSGTFPPRHPTPTPGPL